MDAEAPKIPHTPLTFPLLPPEIHEQIITEAAQHSPRSHLAAVSKEWQLLIEKKTFASLVVDKDQLFLLGEYMTGKRERLVKRICLSVKLSPYNCRYCQGERDWDYHFQATGSLTAL
ncbi:hypothetical protein NW767_014591 [Fusarium falciforme]|nr:hypothetical protein NW767_014591 [Fusarium falciforme]